MKHQAIRSLCVRILVCAVVLGLPYAVIVGLRAHQHAPTANQRRAALNAAIDQTYLLADQLANFKDTGPLASDSLTLLYTQYKTAVANTAATLQHVPQSALTATKRSQVQQFLTKQDGIASSYSAASSLLLEPLQYDPAQDLGGLDVQKDGSKLAARALAAQKGLTAVAQSQRSVTSTGSSGLVAQANQANTPIITPTSKQALMHQADCLGLLAIHVTEQKLSLARDTRATCTTTYPALRAAVIQNILDASFSKQYLATTKTSAQTLLAP